MTKNDLKYGNVVELRNGHLAIFNTCCAEDCFVFLNNTGNSRLKNYNKDLTNIRYSFFDIMKVYKDYTLGELLWERKEIKLTDDEKVILRNLPKEYKYIARDNDGNLFIFGTKPTKYSKLWASDNTVGLCFKHLFQFIKWEDEEPYLIEDLLNGN